MVSRTSAAAASASPCGASSTSSSWTVRIIETVSGSSPDRVIIARLRMSAAVPWMGMFTVARSAAARTWPLRLRSSGTSRRRP